MGTKLPPDKGGKGEAPSGRLFGYVCLNLFSMLCWAMGTRSVGRGRAGAGSTTKAGSNRWKQGSGGAPQALKTQ